MFSFFSSVAAGFVPAHVLIFQIVVFIAAAIAGSIATITGFGIGSVLTPLLATSVGTRLAVAAISIPHFFATVLRFWRLRRHVDKAVLIRFGIPSAAGGLTGALLHNVAANRALGVVFGLLLVFVGISELSGFSRRMRFGSVLGLIAGAVSGFFGGLVGNQGGIRSAALLGFDMDKHAFVATATATGVIVDAARMPAYFVTQGGAISAIWMIVLIATLGTVIGTVFGERLLRRVPERLFRRVVAVLVLALGVYMALFAHKQGADAAGSRVEKMSDYAEVNGVRLYATTIVTDLGDRSWLADSLQREKLYSIRVAMTLRSEATVNP